MRIVITGVGLALPGAEDLAALLRTDGQRGEPVDPGARIGRRGLRYKDRASQLALCAAAEVLTDAGLRPADGELTVAGESVAVVASSNLGNLDTVCEIASAIAEESTDRISPMALPNASSNVVASSVAMKFGLRGPNLMLCNGPTAGLDAVHWGAALVAAGRCERALVVGVETRNHVVEALTGEVDLLDGAVALMVESDEAARARGARAVAELGQYSREGSVAACVDRVLAGGGPPGIWFTPDAAERPEVTPGTPRHDVTGAFGLASGALGVLQCAAAIGWLGTGGAGSALVTAGDDAADGVAGMVLRSAGKGER
ncbi:beta-ketoacyl synthase N-terminal-like domain-containing protein [Saccharopolyspora sp. NPDC050642]|uniref:beta-ketoacyl synthase N-terminal-like domain-containing protein n=1 Tax=Saccharopolyspora sp. NPDC050642 TaxID=3157099 RepID=UPI0033C4C811